MYARLVLLRVGAGDLRPAGSRDRIGKLNSLAYTIFSDSVASLEYDDKVSPRPDLY